MVFFYIILLAVVLCGLRFNRYNQDYISVQQTNAIKGVFIWLVFMGHIMPYIVDVAPFELAVDRAAASVVGTLKQLVVAPFMFYSGYGVMNSIKHKGAGYVGSIPKRRVMTTMLNFGVAVSFFVLLNLILNISMSLERVLLSFVCMASVGNSNWYIFVICICYLSSYLSYKLFGYGKRYLMTNLTLMILFALVISQFKGSWWYDTCLAYSAGSVYCYYKESVERVVNRNYLIYVTLAASALVVSYIVMLNATIAQSLLFMNVCSVCFSLFIVVLSMRLQLKSRLLEWSGKNLFPLYIYQRIPMLLFSVLCGGCLVAELKYVYVIVCAVISIALARLYKYIAIKL